MTFTPINRGKTPSPAGFSATPSDSVRLASYRPSQFGKQLLIIWLGCEVASAIGLSDRRETVSVLTDDSSARRRVAIKPDLHGEFYAAKKLRAYSVHLDATASALLMGDGFFFSNIIGPEGLQFDRQMVAFTLPELRKRGQRP